jgi:molecular chaperone GrpE
MQGSSLTSTSQRSVSSLRVSKKPWWQPFGAAADAGDITSTPAFLQKKLEVLGSELATLKADKEAIDVQIEAEEAEWGTQKTALTNEYVKLQERTREGTKNAEANARVAVVKELLPVLDNLDRAQKNVVVGDGADVAVKAYYDSVIDQIGELLTSFDLKPVPTVGSEFDYNMHEAIQQVPSAEYAEDIVCQEFQKGYMMGDTVIRAAIVAVSVGE